MSNRLSTLAAQHAADPTAEWWVIHGTVPQLEDNRQKIGMYTPRPLTQPRPLLCKTRVVNKPQSAAKPPVKPEAGSTSCPWCVQQHNGQPDGFYKTHTLISCVWPSRQGDIPGCPRCNTVAHDFDNCPDRLAVKVPQSSDIEVQQDTFNYLVRNRASLPPVRSIQSWTDVALALDKPTPRGGYPATKAHVLEQFKNDRTGFLLFHKRNPVRFLDDPATASIDVIRQNAAALALSEAFSAPVRKPTMATEGEFVLNTTLGTGSDNPVNVPIPRPIAKKNAWFNDEDDLVLYSGGEEEDIS